MKIKSNFDIFKPKGKCQQCHKRKATELWSGEGGIMGVVHGAYQYWCKRCCLKAQIEYAERHKDDLKKLKEEWKTL